MKKSTLSIFSGITLAASGMILSSLSPASANVTWSWSYSGIGNTPILGGSGSFITEDKSLGGFYVIIQMNGTAEGGMASLALPGTFSSNDNRLFDPPFPQLTMNGFSFGSTASVFNFNISANFSTSGYSFLFEGTPDAFPVNFSVTKDLQEEETIPESSNLLGLILLGGLMLGSTFTRARQ